MRTTRLVDGRDARFTSTGPVSGVHLCSKRAAIATGASRKRAIGRTVWSMVSLFALSFAAAAAPIAIPEDKESSVELQIKNYTFPGVVRIAICETQAIGDCNADVRTLSDYILITRGGTVVFASEREGGFVGIRDATIFRTEASGAIPDIVVDATDSTGAGRKIDIAVTSDDASSQSDTIDFLRVGNGPPPEVAVIPEPSTWVMFAASWLGLTLLGFVRRRSIDLAV